MPFNIPDCIVEFAPASTPSSTSPTWVDISGYVRHEQGVMIRRGRQSESPYFGPGVLTLTLNNESRIFDPRYAAGPYFGQLLPRKQIRVRALWNAVYYIRFQGFITGWPQEYADGKVGAWVPITAYDALAVLAETAQPDVYGALGASFGTQAFYLSQFDGTTWTSATTPATATANANTGVAIAPKGQPGLVGAGLSLTIWPSSNVVNQAAGQFTRTPSSDWTWSFWLRGPVGARYITWLVDEVTGNYVSITLEDSAGHSGTVHVVQWTGWTGVVPGGTLGTGNFYSADGAFGDGQAHHVVLVYDNTLKQFFLYIDGIGPSYTAGTTNGLPSLYPSLIGCSAGFTSTTSGAATVESATMWPSKLSGAQILNLYQFGVGYYEETTGARFTRLLDNIGWPAALRDLTTGPRGMCGDYAPNGRTTGSELKAVGATEQGRMFVSKDGKVTLHGRYYYLETTRGLTVQATFSDDGADITYRAVGTDYDDLAVANDITVTGSRSIAGNAQDVTSQGVYGLQSLPVSTILTNAQAAKDMAAGLILHKKDATTRTRGPIVVQGAIQTAQWPTILGLEIGDRIQHEITALVGSQAAMQMSIEGTTEYIQVDNWTTSIHAVPVPGSAVAANTFLVLDDAVFGVLDTGRWGY